MRYVSTRGEGAPLAFDDTVLAGLARDGGLYVPEAWPKLSGDDLGALSELEYPALAARIVAPFAEPAVSERELRTIAEDAYRGFAHPDVAPLVRLDDRHHLLELTHGPTLAFKDYALQILGRLFDLVLARRRERLTIVGATSGDTGSAAIEACRDRDAVDIFVLHPHGRVSEVQRRQMTTVVSPNVHNVAIMGTFDDCQALVKAMFNDQTFRDRLSLGAVNSINWARVVAQVVYYVHAALMLKGGRQGVSFAVPTGNFGNVLAGNVAARLGVPIERLIIGSNRNDILTRFFASGTMATDSVVPTISPSMDIQVSSNFERLLFDLYDRDGAQVRDLMAAFQQRGTFAVDARRLAQARHLFAAYRFDDDETGTMIRRTFDETGHMIDPHTAVGLLAAHAYADGPEGRDGNDPIVTLATAHPAKFPDAVEAATGVRPPLPERLADLFERTEHFVVLPNDLAAIQDHVSRTARTKHQAA